MGPFPPLRAFLGSSLVLTSGLVPKSFRDLLKARRMAKPQGSPSPYRDASVALGCGLLQALCPGLHRPTRASILETFSSRQGQPQPQQHPAVPKGKPGGAVGVHPQKGGEEHECQRFANFQMPKICPNLLLHSHNNSLF